MRFCAHIRAVIANFWSNLILKTLFEIVVQCDCTWSLPRNFVFLLTGGVILCHTGLWSGLLRCRGPKTCGSELTSLENCLLLVKLDPKCSKLWSSAIERGPCLETWFYMSLKAPFKCPTGMLTWLLCCRGPGRAVLSSHPWGNCPLWVKFDPKNTVLICSAVRLNVAPNSKLRFTYQWMLHIIVLQDFGRDYCVFGDRDVCFWAHILGVVANFWSNLILKSLF